MLMRRFAQWTVAIALFASIAYAPGCANIQAPMGGPRDSIAPVLLKSTPSLSALNVKGNAITMQFNEYIQLDNLTENLVINPPPDRSPTIQGKLRTLTIKLKDSLLPNTTYTFNFGNALRDVNEGNALKGFTYIMSTGSSIDSLTLGGVVLNAETGAPDSSLLVLLHSHPDDSAVALKKPQFVTKPNGKGRFLFEHLPGGRYYLFALKDEGQKRYTSPEIPLGFYPSAVQAGSDSLHELRTFVAQPASTRKTIGATPGLRTAAAKAAAEAKLKYTTEASTGEQDLLAPLRLSFNKPLGSYDSAKLMLTDTLFRPQGGLRLWLDTTATQLSLQPRWKPDEAYKLLIMRGFATDTGGAAYARTDTIGFKTKPESAYGLVQIKFSGLAAGRPVLMQWVQNNAVVKSVPLQGNVYRVALFEPGQYQLRLVYDANQNGQWDTGDYWKKRQPERVVAIDQTFNIKPNWDNEFEIAVQD
jgi:hypothetical protein